MKIIQLTFLSLILYSIPAMAQIESFEFISDFHSGGGICIASSNTEDNRERKFSFDGSFLKIMYVESGQVWEELQVINSTLKQQRDKSVKWFECKKTDGNKSIIVLEAEVLRYYSFNDLGLQTEESRFYRKR
jgi:hypothetical protein